MFPDLIIERSRRKQATTCHDLASEPSSINNRTHAHVQVLKMDFVTDDIFSLPDAGRFVTVSIRLITAVVLGGLLGYERESVGKAAGLRTHMLVALGAALFVIAPREGGLGEGDVGRIIQGVAAGIGFIGAGTILKKADREQITGLTTAASVWLTAAIGIGAAIGPLWLSLISALCAWIILYGLGKLERR